MEERIDTRSDREVIADRNNKRAVWITKWILVLALFLVLAVFQGCTGLEKTADIADDRFDAVEDLLDVGEDVVREYGKVREFKQRNSHYSYFLSFVNKTCSDYRGEDESGNRFFLKAEKITNATVVSARKGDRGVSVLLTRVRAGAKECAGDYLYSGKINRSREVEIH